MIKKIYADFDEEGVYVYQAFRPQIVQTAVEKGTFGKGFGLDRLSWIKPSFAWTLRRSEYATKHRMEAIARIKLSHEAWLSILGQSIETQWNPHLYPLEDTWHHTMSQSDVIHQWDPERDLSGRRLDRQAIQVGLRGDILQKYVDEYIIKIEDITPLAREIGKVAKARKNNFPVVPDEKEYAVSDKLYHKLGCSD